MRSLISIIELEKLVKEYCDEFFLSKDSLTLEVTTNYDFDYSIELHISGYFERMESDREFSRRLNYEKNEQKILFDNNIKKELRNIKTKIDKINSTIETLSELDI